MDGWMDGLVGGCVGRWVDEWMGGWRYGWMSGKLGIHVIHPEFEAMPMDQCCSGNCSTSILVAFPLLLLTFQMIEILEKKPLQASYNLDASQRAAALTA